MTQHAHTVHVYFRVWSLCYSFSPFKWLEKKKRKKKDRDSEAHDHALSRTNSSTHIQRVKRDPMAIDSCMFVTAGPCVHVVHATVCLFECAQVVQQMDLRFSHTEKVDISVSRPPRKSIWKAVDAKQAWSEGASKRKRKKERKGGEKKQLSGQCSALKCEHRWDLFCKRSCSQCSSVSLWRSVGQHIQLFKSTAVDLCIQ